MIETIKKPSHANNNGHVSEFVPPKVTERQTPSNVEAEQAVLGSVLLDGGAITLINGFLHPEDFYLLRHRWTFEAMCELQKRGAPIDFLSVTSVLEKKERLGEIGGASYITSLLNGVPGVASVRHYAQLVKQAAFERGLIEVGTRFSEIGYAREDDLGEKLSKARKIFDTISEQGTGADPWDSFRRTLADAYAPRPPVEYVVSGLLAKPSLSIVFGAPGSLKSMLLADMCICVAAGLPWLSGLPQSKQFLGFNTKAAPVVWLDFDNGRNRTDERFEAIGRARSLETTIPLSYYAMPSPWLDASDAQSVDALIDRLKKEKTELVVIDNLGVITGGADENSAEMASVMANLRRVAETRNIALVVIHHQRKTNSISTRAGESLRGHSSIEAAIDLALLIEREDRSETVSARATKARGVDVPPFAAHFTFEHREGSKELAAARFWGLETEDMGSDRAVETIILSCVTGNAGIAKTELRDAVKKKMNHIGLNRIAALIDALVGSGKLTVITGDRGAKRYQIAI